MNSNAYIKTPRQMRAVQALLERAVSVKDLGPFIGALNPRQIIFELRRQGFHEIIKTQRFQRTDQDGKLCCPGEYYIPKDLTSIAYEALEKYAAQERLRLSGAAEKLRSHNINRGE